MRSLLLCLASVALSGQTFEVASVKPASPDQRAVDFLISPGGHLRITNLTLLEMVREAYGKKYYQVTGGPSWIDSDRFHVDAKAPGEATRKELMVMLRQLLADRFHLQVREETREGNIYELIVAKNGPKLQKSTADASFLRLYRHTPPELPGVLYTIHGQKITMARLADDLNGTVARPVLDRTGLAGEYDFKIDYAVEGHSEEGPSIYTAVQEQLGLKLQPTKGPIETLVILAAERPTPN